MIEICNLERTFKVLNRKEGLKGAFLDLFSRDYQYVRAVKDISMTVQDGEIVGYVGPNGAGKSTTIKMMTGVLKPTAGCDTKSLNSTVWRQCRPNHPFRWMKPLSPALPVMALFGSGYKRNPTWNPNREGRMKLLATRRLGCRLLLIAWLIN